MRKWRAASSGPNSDAAIDHPSPLGELIEVDHIPMLLAPDPAGVAPRAGTRELFVLSPETPVQHSPITNWNPGSPYPGPPATIHKYIDLDSIRFWGSTGQGKLVWSEHTEVTGDLPPNIPQNIANHVDTFQGFWGGYAPIARNRPPAFGDQVPQFNPAYAAGLPEG